VPVSLRSARTWTSLAPFHSPEDSFMRIAIMGSGGVGGSVGARLQTAGEDVAFIARGAHLPALRRDGPVHRIAAATTALAAGACL